MMGEKQPPLGEKQDLISGSISVFPCTWLESVSWGLVGSSYFTLVYRSSGRGRGAESALLLPCLELDI